MFDPIKELALAVAATVAFSLWCYFDPSPESFAALGLAVTGIIAASIHLAYKSRPEETFKIDIKAVGAATSVPPYGTGEPMHLKIELTVINTGSMPVFIVAAALKDKTGSRSLGFSDVCHETEPLQPGGRRKGMLELLFHTPFPKYPHSARTKEALKQDNIFAYKLLRFVCQKDSVFQLETGRGNKHDFPATKICDSNFLGWAFLATPNEILEEFQSKTVDDFVKEEREAFEKAGAKFGPGEK
jgi:hypothetical protein